MCQVRVVARDHTYIFLPSLKICIARETLQQQYWYHTIILGFRVSSVVWRGGVSGRETVAVHTTNSSRATLAGHSLADDVLTPPSLEVLSSGLIWWQISGCVSEHRRQGEHHQDGHLSGWIGSQETRSCVQTLLLDLSASLFLASAKIILPTNRTHLAYGTC